MGKVKLVNWLGAEDIESFNPQCSIINRILSYAKIDFENLFFQIHSSRENIVHKISSIPALIDGEKAISGYWQSEKHIFENFFITELIPSQTCQRAKNNLLHQWGMSQFYDTTLFYVYLREKNFSVFKEKVLKVGIERGLNIGESNTSLDLLKDIIDQKIRGHQLYLLTPEDQDDYLFRQFDIIDYGLDKKNFLVRDNQISLADISLFCLVNRILLPEFDHSVIIRNKYYQIMKWMERVGKLTASKQNVFPAHLFNSN